MPEINLTSPTIDAIYAAYETDHDSAQRPHLGASRIGHPCSRFLWYEFRWCLPASFPGRMLRLFDTGNREEPRIVADLRRIGVEVHDYIEGTGKQIHYSDPECPHFSGSLDGIGRGFPEAPKAWHVLEFKTHNDKSFKLLQKAGVEHSKPEHYAQMQMYMHWSQIYKNPAIDRAFYFAINKNDDEYYAERIHYNKEHAERLTERAHHIIYADTPPDRMKGASYDGYRCKFCNFRDLCFGKTCADINCRTCANSEPMKDGRWYCNLGTVFEGNICCDHHIFIPALVPMECTGADAAAGTISYITDDGKEIINGPGHVSSEELKEMVNDGL